MESGWRTHCARPRIPPEAAETSAHPRRPTLDDVWAFLPVAIPMLVSLASRMVTVDLAYHVRVGEVILSGDGIPRVDTLSFVNEGAAWLDQQWLAQVFVAIAHRGGFATVALLRACLIGGSFGFIYLSCRAKGASPRASSLLALSGFIVCLQALAMRPQLLAFFLFSASLWILTTRRSHPRRCWALVGIAVVWANVHGSFFLLPLLCAIAAAEDSSRDVRDGEGWPGSRWGAPSPPWPTRSAPASGATSWSSPRTPSSDRRSPNGLRCRSRRSRGPRSSSRQR